MSINCQPWRGTPFTEWVGGSQPVYFYQFVPFVKCLSFGYRQEHYLHKDKDCTQLEKSSQIAFHYWKSTVELLVQNTTCSFYSILKYMEAPPSPASLQVDAEEGASIAVEMPQVWTENSELRQLDRKCLKFLSNKVYRRGNFSPVLKPDGKKMVKFSRSNWTSAVWREWY